MSEEQEEEIFVRNFCCFYKLLTDRAINNNTIVPVARFFVYLIKIPVLVPHINLGALFTYSLEFKFFIWGSLADISLKCD